MAQKANQHVIPQVYTRAFCDSHPPADWAPGRPYTPCLWLIPRDLREPGYRRAPKNAFAKRHVYTLRTDQPNAPVLEDGLHLVETQFGRIRPLVERGEDLTLDDYNLVTLFIGTLRSRLLEQLDHWQRQWERVEEIHRQVERGATGSETASDIRFWMKDEASRRLLFTLGGAHAEVIQPHGWFLRNHTHLGFVTSDRPVIHTFPYSDELARLFVDMGIVAADATPADWAFFCYAPLSPIVSFVSSPLIVPPEETLYRELDDYRVVIRLNELIRRNAAEVIVAHVPRPYGNTTETLAAFDEHVRRARNPESVSGLAVYTEVNRFFFPSTDFSMEPGDNPLFPRIVFRCEDVPSLRAMAVTGVLRSVVMIRGGRPCGGLQGATLLAVAISPLGESIIQGDPA